MILFCIFCFDASGRINVDTTELLTAFPTPGAPATGSNHKGLTSGGKSAREYVVTCVIFQTPAFAPGTLFWIHDFVDRLTKS